MSPLFNATFACPGIGAQARSGFSIPGAAAIRDRLAAMAGMGGAARLTPRASILVSAESGGLDFEGRHLIEIESGIPLASEQSMYPLELPDNCPL
jgi:hypothetical protein